MNCWMFLTRRVFFNVRKIAEKFIYDEDLSLISFTRKNDERPLLFQIEFLPENGFKGEASLGDELVVDELSKYSVLEYVTNVNRALCGTARLDYDLNRRVVKVVSCVSFGFTGDGRFNFDMATLNPILDETAFLATEVSEFLKIAIKRHDPNT